MPGAVGSGVILEMAVCILFAPIASRAKVKPQQPIGLILIKGREKAILPSDEPLLYRVAGGQLCAAETRLTCRSGMLLCTHTSRGKSLIRAKKEAHNIAKN